MRVLAGPHRKSDRSLKLSTVSKIEHFGVSSHTLSPLSCSLTGMSDRILSLEAKRKHDNLRAACKKIQAGMPIARVAKQHNVARIGPRNGQKKGGVKVFMSDVRYVQGGFLIFCPCPSCPNSKILILSSVPNDLSWALWPVGGG